MPAQLARASRLPACEHLEDPHVCMRVANALARLYICTGTADLSLCITLNPHSTSTGWRFRYAHDNLGFSLKLFQIAAEA